MTVKPKPHYPLPDVKRLVEQERVIISKAAREDAALMGIDRQGILEAIHNLSVSVDFSKAVFWNDKPTPWHDSYITWYNDHNIYIKFFVRYENEEDASTGQLIVASFKPNTN